MKTIITFICVFVSVTMFIQGDVYVKENLHFPSIYYDGRMHPEEDVLLEWWFSKDKVFISEGEWSYILDKEKQRMVIINRTEKIYFEISLPLNTKNHVEKELAERLNRYKINGKIKRTKEKKTIDNKVCDIFKITEWITYQANRFFDRDRTVMVTINVPFNWKLVNELYQNICSFFNPNETYIEELKQIRGFIYEADNVRYLEGTPIKFSSKVKEIIRKEAPRGIYNIPEGFRKKENFEFRDLIAIRRFVYKYRE